MNLRAAILTALIPLAACAADERAPEPETGAVADSAAEPAAPDSTLASDSALTPDGWGPLRIGMSRAEVVAAAGEDANPELVGGPEPERCDQFRPTGAPEHMLIMLVNDTLSRITIMRESEVRTARGFGIGDSAADIHAAYGTAAVESPHKYRDAPSAYITVWQTPPGGDSPARGIVYDIGDDGRVALVHAGAESIRYVEGCL